MNASAKVIETTESESESRRVPTRAISKNAPSTPADLVRYAMSAGADIEKLERLYALQQRYEADQAKKAFMEAVAAFKANPPVITKDKENKQYGSYYTSLANLVNTANEKLAPHGLNARWDLHQTDQITVSCILSHVAGHSESVSLSGPPDVSGSKNALQQVKSTVTYLRGATFESVVGIASTDFNTDDDANSAAADKVVADWTSAINECVDVAALEKRGAELAASTIDGKTRRLIKPVYAAKLNALKKAAKTGAANE